MYDPIAHLTLIITLLALCSAVYQDLSLSSSSSSSINENGNGNGLIKIDKCCEMNELMIDTRCVSIKELDNNNKNNNNNNNKLTKTKPWNPVFIDESGSPLGSSLSPKYELRTGLPKCKNTETKMHIYNTRDFQMDLLMILQSGTLRHCINFDELKTSEDEFYPNNGHVNNNNNQICYDYDYSKYCADNAIIENKDETLFYAQVCLPINEKVMHTDVMMERVIDPAFRAISIACYLIVAIVYFVLPQLRNLIGNIITSMTICLVTSQCADMVRIFTDSGSHVSFFVADTVTYVSLLAAFFWLNSLGYYIWRTFRSRNIFLRVTDGRKYCYYSIYVWSSTAAMGAMAVFAHFVLDTDKQVVGGTLYAPQETFGWLGVAVFFTPIAFTIFINLWFVITTMRSIRRMNTYGRIHHKMKYSFRMFVFLFLIMGISLLFTLLSWIRNELAYCYIVINLLQAILILYICVFGQRRVTFLLRKTFNCCSPGETNQGLDWGEEMTAMNVR